MSALGWGERQDRKAKRHIERQLKMGLTAQEYQAWHRKQKKERKAAWAAELAKDDAEFLPACDQAR